MTLSFTWAFPLSVFPQFTSHVYGYFFNEKSFLSIHSTASRFLASIPATICITLFGNNIILTNAYIYLILVWTIIFILACYTLLELLISFTSLIFRLNLFFFFNKHSPGCLTHVKNPIIEKRKWFCRHLLNGFLVNNKDYVQCYS